MKVILELDAVKKKKKKQSKNGNYKTEVNITVDDIEGLWKKTTRNL